MADIARVADASYLRTLEGVAVARYEWACRDIARESVLLCEVVRARAGGPKVPAWPGLVALVAPVAVGLVAFGAPI